MNPLMYANASVPPHARVGAFVANAHALGWAFAFLRAFPDSDVYLVGGTVRDAILGKYPHSIHTLVRDVTPPKLSSWLTKHGNTQKKGEGVWSFTPEGTLEPVEVMVPRGKHIEEDMRNRDFTVNAMAFSVKNGRLFDPFHGMSDLALGQVRTVRDPYEHFHTEPHSMARALRLATQLGATIEQSTWHALSNLGHHMHRTDHQEDGAAAFTVPRAKLGKDFLLGLNHHPHYFLKLLKESGSRHHFAPELGRLDQVTFNDGETGWTKTERLLHFLSSPSHLRTYGIIVPSIALIVAALFIFLDDQARPGLRSLTGRLHLHDTNDRRTGFSYRDAAWLIDKVSELEHAHPKDFSLAKAEKLFGANRGSELLALLHAKQVTEGAHPEKRERFHGFTRLRDLIASKLESPKLVRGRDLVALGITPGPHMRSILERIRDAQLHGHLSSRPAALDFARYLIYGKPA